MARILVVDDEQDLCEILQFNLLRQGYEVEVAYSAEEALPKLQQKDYDLVLLDVMMDGMSGFEMAQRMKRDEGGSHQGQGKAPSAIPIIFCTAKDTEDDTLRGFGLGADDYIAKPFRIPEVLARVKAVLRRSASAGTSPEENSSATEDKERLSCNGITIHTTEKRVYAGDTEIILTRKEYDILVLLMSSPGHIFSRDDILLSVWPDDVFVLDRSVDVCIARLRKKLGSDYARYIVSRSGYGYVFQS